MGPVLHPAKPAAKKTALLAEAQVQGLRLLRSAEWASKWHEYHVSKAPILHPDITSETLLLMESLRVMRRQIEANPEQPSVTTLRNLELKCAPLAHCWLQAAVAV